MAGDRGKHLKQILQTELSSLQTSSQKNLAEFATSFIDPAPYIDNEIDSDTNTKSNIFGIVDGNIVMTGGGQGKSSQSFQFTLNQNQ